MEESKGKQRSKQSRRSKVRESSIIYKTGELPKMRGGGIAMRLAIAISATILLIMVIVAIVMLIFVADAVDEQIDAGGVVAARLLAASDVDSWKRDFGLNIDEMPRDEYVTRVQFNQGRLASVLSESSQFLNAQIQVMNKYNEASTRRDAQDPFFKLKDDERPEFKKKAAGKSFTLDEVKVQYGFMTVKGQYYDSRSYQAPIKDYLGATIGYATVVLSEDQITAQKWSLAGAVVVLFVVFIGIGIGISIFVGRKISKPVQALIEDVTIVAGGDLKHHTVPRSPDEIGLLARTFDKMTKNLHDAQQKEAELAAQKHQLAVAQEVQSNLLPDTIPQVDDYEIMAFHRSSRQVDGNYYDMIEYPDGKIGVLVAAASGKGIPAAMVMTMARSFFRALVEGAKDPAKMMRETNRLLSPDLRAGMYVEVLMVLIDPSTNKAKLVSAGPTSLLRFNFASKKLQQIHAEGIALGFDKGPVFDKTLKEVEFDLAPGDRLVLNTPGLFTIKNLEGAELGPMGFAKAVNMFALQPSDIFVDRVVTVLDQFAGQEVHDSDITFLTVRRKEA